MTIRRRPPAQDLGRILGGKMAPEDFIKMMNATELNCDTLEKIAENEAEDFVTVCERLGDEAYAYAEKMNKQATWKLLANTTSMQMPYIVWGTMGSKESMKKSIASMES